MSCSETINRGETHAWQKTLDSQHSRCPVFWLRTNRLATKLDIDIQTIFRESKPHKQATLFGAAGRIIE